MNMQHLVKRKSAFMLNTLTISIFGALSVGHAVAEETTQLPVVMVYGEKTERTLQETSSSVRVFDEDEMKAVNANEARDLMRLTPNVVDTGFGNTVPTVRGLDGAGPGKGAMAFMTGTRPRLNVSVDGRSLTYNELAFGPMSMWDMQQAEIYLARKAIFKAVTQLPVR
ncbi:TonB-dependent receptor plug domain-containing protein [Vibrio sonorensis]|uniref:TonB-dependent receptor plug domain-containing protein n=1 Tax=Vibrio sonorensis TaxID=1004316 RepID=UPI000ADBBE63|nr:Plug domain-containing protein [Vibrio sonorensis]